MKKYKICVYAICKNEESFVSEWIESMSEADMIVVTDTGSSDNTVERLKDGGAIVYEEEIIPWRFDTARNISLSHVPMDVDICVCTDLDERFEKGWREKLENGWDESLDTATYIYNWSLKPDGSPDVQFRYFKIHTRNNYRWKCPVHEYLQYTGKGNAKRKFIEGIVLNHFPDASKSRGSYISLLEMAVREEPESSRMNYYLGREYMYMSRWEDCISALKTYLSLPSSNWAEERCAAMRWIAKSYYNLNDTALARAWYYSAIGECPAMREPYVEFAWMEYELKNYILAYFLISEAFKIKEKSATFVNTGYCWDNSLYELSQSVCLNLGLNESAHYSGESI